MSPLAAKLGYEPAMPIWADAMPDPVRREIEAALPAPPRWLDRPEAGMAACHLFVTTLPALAARLEAALAHLARDGMIWVSWRKRGAAGAGALDREAIRNHVLATTELVDIKVCAVDPTWSGLKFVIRKEAR